jgi:hypothetical protein
VTEEGEHENKEEGMRECKEGATRRKGMEQRGKK